MVNLLSIGCIDLILISHIGVKNTHEELDPRVDSVVVLEEVGSDFDLKGEMNGKFKLHC